MRRLAGALVAAAVLVVACGGDDVASVRVALTTSTIRIEPVEVAQGKVSLKLENLSMASHSVVLLRTALPFDRIAQDADDPVKLAQMGMLARVEVPATQSADLTLTLSAGRYVVLCGERAHYDYGMRAALLVK